MRELIRTNRISGMAYEPAWLAGEIRDHLFAVAFRFASDPAGDAFQLV